MGKTYFVSVRMSSPLGVLTVAVFFQPGSSPKPIIIPVSPWDLPPVMTIW